MTYLEHPDLHLARAKAAMLRMAGGGVLACGLGGAALLGAYAYSHFVDQRSAGASIAEGLRDKLAETQVRLPLDPAAQVRLDPASQLRLAPNSAVAVAGRVGVDATELKLPEGTPLPSPAQLRADNKPETQKQVITSFTVFKEVAWNDGKVVTGYKFNLDKTKAIKPTDEWCYYERTITYGSTETIYMGKNGAYDYGLTKQLAGVDARDAARNCVWFDGQPTRF